MEGCSFVQLYAALTTNRLVARGRPLGPRLLRRGSRRSSVAWLGSAATPKMDARSAVAPTLSERMRRGQGRVPRCRRRRWLGAVCERLRWCLYDTTRLGQTNVQIQTRQ
ncbi:hypothetical protein MRX96_003814 [Rhipicephalus microplus]